MEFAFHVHPIEELDNFISSFKSVRRKKLFDMDEIKFTQTVVIGIPNNERWFYPIHLRELFDQLAVIPGDSAVFLK